MPDLALGFFRHGYTASECETWEHSASA